MQTGHKCCRVSCVRRSHRGVRLIFERWRGVHQSAPYDVELGWMEIHGFRDPTGVRHAGRSVGTKPVKTMLPSAGLDKPHRINQYRPIAKFLEGGQRRCCQKVRYISCPWLPLCLKLSQSLVTVACMCQYAMSCLPVRCRGSTIGSPPRIPIASGRKRDERGAQMVSK